MPQAGVVVLSASFDSGWTADVDGQRARTFPVAPALVAARVPAGVHRVTFRYAGFSGYSLLFVLSGLSVAVLAAIDRKGRVVRRVEWHAWARPTLGVEGESIRDDEPLLAAGGGAPTVLEGSSDDNLADEVVGASHGQD
jgi:hypothetical protein